MKKIFCVLILIGFIALSCEKDDICDPSTPTTPRLVIKFYDFNNPSVTKRINNLKIVGDGINYSNGVLNNQGSQFWTDSLVYLPLRVNQDVSKFRFIRFATQDTILANARVDTLEFNYSRRDEYVSRACGFKTIFDLNGGQAEPFILNDDENATLGNWIRNIEVESTNINNEDETHINLYFL
ncbi:MAG: hypothetical protein EOO46_06015 [Flavobacterium sp.]|nr:MAG: hypothetical protein EOO46_06015 [Flavobacterium sp.]